MSEAEPPAAPAKWPPRAELVPALRPLAWFWAAMLLVVVLGAGALQWLGPPSRGAASSHSAGAATQVASAPAAPPAPLPSTAAPAEAMQMPVVAAIPGVHPIAPPQPALEQPLPGDPATLLPRISDERRSPMQVYAAYADPAERRPRIAILVAGIGMSTSESEDAIDNLPPAMSLAVSPYAYKPDPLLAEARAHGHEYLVSIPMEPQGYPLDDPGNRALMTGNTDAENLRLLDWALGRFGGYIGATGALGGLRGERFAGSTAQIAQVMAELAARGLLYVDPRPEAPRQPYVVGRSVDVVVDAPAVRTEIEARLAELEQVAHDRGSAIGLVGQPLPVTIDRLVAWSNTLASRGFALVPVSAVAPIVAPPLRASALTLSGAGSP